MVARKPACMSEDEFELWATANAAINGVTDRVSSVCHDCLPAFSVEMRAEGRCDGVPLGHLQADRDLTPRRLSDEHHAIIAAGNRDRQAAYQRERRARVAS